jgi:hypothetical protein
MAAVEPDVLTRGIESGLNAATAAERIASLRRLLDRDMPFDTPLSEEVNNHVHTIYSFSPYSPTLAAYMARSSGLKAVGSVDHDSISAANEMIEACSVIGMGSTVGCELRVNFSGTRVEGRRLNNPDSVNIAYMVIHGVPASRIPELIRFLEPVHEQRNKRNRAQVNRMNELTGSEIPQVSFERDVYDQSCAAEGGSITERHILAALSRNIMRGIAGGDALLRYLEQKLLVKVPERIAPYLVDERNPHRIYDLLGVLKSSFLDRIFIQPDEKECFSVFDVVAFANRIGAIPAYAYLGDVGESPTGDKRAEKYEDDFLDELVPELARIGFHSVTYMPPRNSVDQLRRVQGLCNRFDLLEISGVDINSSRQSFRCPEIMMPEFRHLNDTTWALIAHEKFAACDARYGLFSADNPLSTLPLSERVQRYAEAGRGMDPTDPSSACDEISTLQS